MSAYEDQKSLYRDVQRALWTEWDPIGVNTADHPGPPDEYDGYASAVLHALNAGGGDVGLARTLEAIERESMGIDRPFADVLLAARRIRATLNWQDRDIVQSHDI